MENTKLTYLHQHTDQMTPEQRARVMGYLIGWLSVEVELERWKNVVDLAVQQAKQ
jgi:hypothetical protein